MQEIELSQHKVAILDDEDFARLRQHRWIYRGERNGRPGYAIRHVKDGQRYRTVYLHREVMSPIPPGYEVIFRNGDRLDCRRANLRVVSRQEARRQHRRARSDSRSGVKGISYNRRPGTWSVTVYRSGRSRRVGTFLTQKEAADAYLAALAREEAERAEVPEVVGR
jgi:HNH endonuclease/AP2 domain